MKKLVMPLLVASLLITTVWSLSSCKKTNTNTNNEVLPVTVNYILYEGDESNTRDIYTDCVYKFTPPHYCNDPVLLCDHGINYFTNGDTICYVHNHVHLFKANEDCTPINYTVPFFCIYKLEREHLHAIKYFPRGYHNDWHLGGGTN